MPLDSLSQPRLLDLPTVIDERGSLTFAENDKPLPFSLHRVYLVHGIPAGVERGGHAHRRISEVIVAAAGGFTVHLYAPDGSEQSFALDSPTVGLYIPAMWWRFVNSYLPDSLCLVLASGAYEEEEYIRDPGEFFEGP